MFNPLAWLVNIRFPETTNHRLLRERQQYKYWYEDEEKENRRLRQGIQLLEDRLRVRRAMTPPFDELQHFKEKKRRRFNKILKQENNFRRLDVLDRIARNMGLTLNIKIIDLQTPPRHEPIEIKAGASNVTE